MSVGSFLNSCSYQFDDSHASQPYQYVVIERQLRNKTLRSARLEANLEGFYGATCAALHLMPADKKLTEHGLQLDSATANKIANREAAAKQRHKKAYPTSQHDLNKQQKTRLNKNLAVDLCDMFLDQNRQSSTMHGAFKAAAKKDDMADALLQAIAFANIHLH